MIISWTICISDDNSQIAKAISKYNNNFKIIVQTISKTKNNSKTKLNYGKC